MSRPMIRIHDLATDEVVDREMTAAEYKVYEAEQAEQLTKQAEAESKATARQTLLTKLGITAEEAQLLLGGN